MKGREAKLKEEAVAPKDGVSTCGYTGNGYLAQ